MNTFGQGPTTAKSLAESCHAVYEICRHIFADETGIELKRCLDRNAYLTQTNNYLRAEVDRQDQETGRVKAIYFGGGLSVAVVGFCLYKLARYVFQRYFGQAPVLPAPVVAPVPPGG